MKRRGFLTQAAAMLAAVGLGELGLESGVGRSGQAGRVGAHWQAMAAAGGRRFALLIGIDRYDSAEHDIPSLSGCVKDVLLQRQLLQYRFGFAPENITEILNEAATGDRIEAELQRLAILLEPSDALVLHFSGYGGQFQSPISAEVAAPPTTNAARSAIVAADARPYALTDLSERLGRLPTRNAIATLDASYTQPDASCRQEMRARVLPTSKIDTEAPFGVLSTALKQRREPTSPRPTIVTYDRGGWATERRWSGFDAGVLTYALTQSLWHLDTASSWKAGLISASAGVERAGSAPLRLQTRTSRAAAPWKESAIEVGITPVVPASAIGAIVAASTERTGSFEVWLGGLEASVLSCYGDSSIVTSDRQALTRSPLAADVPPIALTETATEDTAPEDVASDAASDSTSQDAAPSKDPAENRRNWLQIERERGLQRAARPLGPLDETAIGSALFEVMRVIPRSIQLGVALESHLSRIERVDATSALSSLRGIEAIPSGEADCWFGCASNCASAAPASTESNTAALTKTKPRTRYTLQSHNRQPIFDCAAEPDAAIKRAIRNLEPRLQDLRAFKILAATENSNASMLKVRVTYGFANTDPTIPDRGLRRVCQTAAVATSNGSRDRPLLQLDSGSRLQYRIENLGDRPLHFLLVRLDPCGRLSIPDTASRTIGARDALAVPERPEATAWNVERDPGLVRLFAILSDRPFAKTRQVLAKNHATGSRDLAREPAADLSGEVAEAIAADLDASSRAAATGLDFSADNYAFDVRCWATLSLTYRIVEGDDA